MSECRLCPRLCGADRSRGVGFCGARDKAVVARASLHKWEEPCVSVGSGAGTIFFSLCNLRCVFCQNVDISHSKKGKELSDSELAELMLKLQKNGADNIDLVTPTPYAENIRSAVALIKDRLFIPVIYNCSGYELKSTVASLKGTVDIFLTDIKFKDSEKSRRYLKAFDYYNAAVSSLSAMIETVGKPKFSGDKLISGVIVRHLVMPGCYRDSLEILNDLKERFGTDSFILSLMSQYIPCGDLSDFPEIDRRITSFEYKKVTDRAADLGFRGYTQQRGSADTDYIPDFSDGGVL